MALEQIAGTLPPRPAEWPRSVIAAFVSRERAKHSFEGFVDPPEIDRTFDLWREA